MAAKKKKQKLKAVKTLKKKKPASSGPSELACLTYTVDRFADRLVVCLQSIDHCLGKLCDYVERIADVHGSYRGTSPTKAETPPEEKGAKAPPASYVDAYNADD